MKKTGNRSQPENELSDIHFDYHKNAVIISTHFLNDYVISKYHKIYNDLDHQRYDVILLMNTDEEIMQTHLTDMNVCIVNTKDISELHYTPIKKTLLPGSCHFPVLSFFLNNIQYNQYWVIEYDVEFTGDWSILLDDYDKKLSDYDFISCHIERYNENKNKHWYWWHDNNNVGYKLEECIKSFNPICRYSRNALSYVDLYQKLGNSAHSEILIATCLYHAGYKIGDIGGNSEFTPGDYIQKYYSSTPDSINNGSMRYRPLYTRQTIEMTGLKNHLFHPLKE